MTMLAAVLGAVAAALVAWMLLRPHQAMADTIRPWASPNRTRLGRPADVAAHADTATAAVSGVVSPMLAAAVRAVLRLADHDSDDQLLLSLRQAGVDQHLPSHRRLMRHRLRRVGGLAVGGVAGGAVAAAVADQWTIPVVAVCGGLVGLQAPAQRLSSKVQRRSELMALQLQPLTHNLAITQMSDLSIDAALRRIVARGQGPIIDELADVLRWTDSGRSLHAALRSQAAATAQPHAARAYKTLATASEQGAPVAEALLALSADVRAARREQMERSAIRRRSTLVFPIMFLLMPPVLLLISPLMINELRSL